MTKSIVDHLGLSLLLFNIPGDDHQYYATPKFNIKSQRLDSLHFQDKQVGSVITFPPSGIDYIPESVYETYDTVPDSHRDLVFVEWKFDDPDYANQVSLTLFDSQT